MSTFAVKMSGFDELEKRLSAVIAGAKEIELAAVKGGCFSLLKAIREAVPGTTKNEVGMRIKGNVGRVGVMKYPRQISKFQRRIGVRQPKGPHLIYLEVGTKFIAARHYVSNTLNSTKPRAARAMKYAAIAKVKELFHSA